MPAFCVSGVLCLCVRVLAGRTGAGDGDVSRGGGQTTPTQTTPGDHSAYPGSPGKESGFSEASSRRIPVSTKHLPDGEREGALWAGCCHDTMMFPSCRSSSSHFLDSSPFSDSMESPHLRRLMMDLDSYTPPSRRSRHSDGLSRDRHSSVTSQRLGRHRSDDVLLEEIIAESRRDFEADRQMAAG